jgi:hypothetical protein
VVAPITARHGCYDSGAVGDTEVLEGDREASA